MCLVCSKGSLECKGGGGHNWSIGVNLFVLRNVSGSLGAVRGCC